jgi:rubrerythrin
VYAAAKQAVESGKDAEAIDIWVCTICGFTMEGEPPERCPVCDTPRDKFRKF